ncbi:MAG: LON peptidase substrate-binding domain-containing protein [Chloroflexi bacterium]|nr:LON peptidase substrate-binding domain-containing protein [Chloroflexota bacterium]
MSETLPIFPLNTVLFPGAPLPLRIFEPRYREMLKRCLDGDRRFGVALIKSGPEVGGPAEPHDVGTVARIERVRDEGGRDSNSRPPTWKAATFRAPFSRPFELEYLGKTPGSRSSNIALNQPSDFLLLLSRENVAVPQTTVKWRSLQD